MAREYTCKQCRQRIVDVSGWPGGDVCSTCVHIPHWHSDPKLRELFMFAPYAEGCLRAFAQELFQGWPDDFGSFDGFDLQDLAVKHGLFQPVEVTEPCGENCACAEYGEWPTTCYRRTAVLTGKQP